MSKLQHMVCPHCNAISRISSARLAVEPKCGNCHKTLFTAHRLDLTDSNIQKHISRNHIPVVVDFWAPWCGPCKMMALAFEQAAAQLQPTARLTKTGMLDDLAGARLDDGATRT